MNITMFYKNNNALDQQNLKKKNDWTKITFFKDHTIHTSYSELPEITQKYYIIYKTYLLKT